MLAGCLQRGSCFSVRRVRIGQAAKPGEIRPARQALRKQDDRLTVDLERGAEERPHTESLAGLQEADGSIDAARVSGAPSQLPNMSGAIQDREVAVAVQLHVHVHSVVDALDEPAVVGEQVQVDLTEELPAKKDLPALA